MSNTFADRILELRKRRKWSQAALGQRLGVSAVTVCCWERSTCFPQSNRVAEVAKVLGVSCDFLLTGRENPHHAALIAAVRRAGTRDPTLAALLERA